MTEALPLFPEAWESSMLDNVVSVDREDSTYMAVSKSDSKRSSEDLMEDLQKQGIRERWAIRRSELIFSGDKFASGSGGELFRVRWRGLECVAKTCPLTVNKQVLIDLANEIGVLSTLRHPNLVMFLGACFEPHKPPIMLMEYCDGGNLETKLCQLSETGNKLKSKDALKYTMDLALAINFLHNCGPPVVHRDLKPSNILLTKGGQIKVTDFGLSKFIPKRDVAMTEKYTMTGETGSYRFMAPEVFRHEEYNEKVDVYSFGLIVYWMLTGYRPFSDILNPIEAAKLAAENKRSPNASLIQPAAIRSIISSCWSSNPDNRPSFVEIVEKLQRFSKDKLSRTGSCVLQ